jgi:hypothetical protein
VDARGRARHRGRVLDRLRFRRGERLLDREGALLDGQAVLLGEAHHRPAGDAGQQRGREQAAAAGVAEAWMHEDGLVTEGGSSTAFIITEDGTKAEALV